MVITKSFEKYEDALAFITAHEEEHGLRFVVWKVAKEFLGPLTGSIHKKKLRYPTDEIPYLHLRNGSAYRSCSLGGREGAKHIKKPRTTLSSITGKRKRPYENMDEEDKALPVCPAEVVVRSVTIFPEYEVCKNWDKYHKQQVTERLRKEFSHEKTVTQRLFIVHIDENHTDHRKNYQLRLDPRATDVIMKLTERGYYSALDILDMMKKEIAKMPDVRDPEHSRFNPSLDRIRKITFTHVVRQRNLEREKGYTHDMYEPLQRMAELEQETNTSFLGDFESFGLIDVYDAAPSKAIYTSTEADLRCKLATDSVPFIVLQTKHLDCAHGVEYQNKFVLPFTPRQRKHMSKEGMVMCTARCTFKEIALFPGYRIDKDLQQKHVRGQILDRLRQDLNNRTAEYERVVAYAFPVGDEHCGHHVREANGHVFLDERIKAEIAELVAEGVRSLSEMRRHLKMYLKHNFDEVSMPGPFNKRYRPSNQTIMNLMYDAGLDPKEIIQDVGEAVEFISKPSLYKDISTRVAEKKKRFEASATMSLIADAESLAETPYSTLIENMDVFQTIPTTPSKTGSRSDSSPLKTPPGVSGSGNKDADGFSELQFKKQSDCQVLLEELLQAIYEMNDLFRLRDLNTHLRKLVSCVKAGQLLCDLIPLNKKRVAPTSTTVTEVGNVGQDDDHKYTATPVNIETGLASATTSEEPPTKIVIMDQDDKVTEVDLPKDYDSSEIVIYQENDETGEQIYLVDKKMFAEEKGEQAEQTEQGKQPEQAEVQLPVITECKPTISEEINEKRKQYKEKAQRDMIKVKCKRYVSKEEIVRNLNITINPPKSEKTPAKHKPLDVRSDIKQEIKAQNAELKKYEKDKIKLSEMETSYMQKATHPEKAELDIDKYVKYGKRSNKMFKAEMKTDHEYSEKTNVDGEDESIDMCSSESEDGLCDGEIVLNIPKTRPNSSEKLVQTTKTVTDSLSKQLTGASKVPNVHEGNPSLAGKTGVPAQTKTPSVSSRSLKVGDTITFPAGGYMNNQGNTGNIINNPGLTGGLIAINNIVYTNTPYGLVPAFGMPMVVNGQNTGMIIGNAAANSTVLGMAGNPAGMLITSNPYSGQTTTNPCSTPTPSTPLKTSDASIQPTPSTPGSASKKVTSDDGSNNSPEGEKTTNIDSDAKSNDTVGTSEKELDSEVNQAPSSSGNGSDSMNQPVVSKLNGTEKERTDNSSAEGQILETKNMSSPQNNLAGQGINKPKTVAMVNIPCVSLTPGMAIKKIGGSSSSKNVLEKYVVLPASPSPSKTGKEPKVAIQGKGPIESSVPNVLGSADSTTSNQTSEKAGSATNVTGKNVVSCPDINNENKSKVNVVISAKITDKSSDGGQINTSSVKTASQVTGTSVSTKASVLAAGDGKEDTITLGETEKSAKAVDEHFYAKTISHNEGEIIITVCPSKPEDKNIKTKDCPTEIAQNLPETNSILKNAGNSVKKGVPLATESGDTGLVVDPTKPSTRDTACDISEQVSANPNSARKGTNNGTTISSPGNPTKAIAGKGMSVGAVLRLVKLTNSGGKTVEAKDNVQAAKDKTPKEKKGVSGKSNQVADKKGDGNSKPNQMSAKKKNASTKKEQTPVRKKEVEDLQTTPSRKQDITVKKEGTPMTRSNKGQSPALMSNNDDITNSGKMKTRGRQMRFSRGGEKLD